jgi:hypothetical protein
VCLAIWPGSSAAAARHRLSTPAGVRRTATRSLATCAASKAQSNNDDSTSQQQRPDAAEAAPKQTRSSHTPVKHVPWDAATEAAVIQFWTEQGGLLPAAEVQPEQQMQQRRLRSKVLRWAAKYPRHRDLDFLQDYMARVRDAAAASGWTGEQWRIVLVDHDVIAANYNPALILQRVQATEQKLVAYGIRIPHSTIVQERFRGKNIAAQAASLQLALESLPISLKLLTVLRRAPALMLYDDATAVLGRRVAAMQLLHPRLDIERVLQRDPILLSFTEHALAAHWASLQQSCGLCDDEMMALVQHQPSVLTLSSGVVGWRVQQIRGYEVVRKTAGATSTTTSSWGRVLTAASFRTWRLRYLSVVGNTKYSTSGWVKMAEERFAALNPGYSSWLASNPVPAGAYRDRHD